MFPIKEDKDAQAALPPIGALVTMSVSASIKLPFRCSSKCRMALSFSDTQAFRLKSPYRPSTFAEPGHTCCESVTILAANAFCIDAFPFRSRSMLVGERLARAVT